MSTDFYAEAYSDARADLELALIQRDLVENDLYGLLQKLQRQPDGSYVLSAKYEIEVNDAKRLVGLV